MRTCRTCEHFGQQLGDTDLHACDQIDYAKPGSNDNRIAAVFSNEYAALCVRADFGCVQWEERGAMKDVAKHH